MLAKPGDTKVKVPVDSRNGLVVQKNSLLYPPYINDESSQVLLPLPEIFQKHNELRTAGYFS